VLSPEPWALSPELATLGRPAQRSALPPSGDLLRVSRPAGYLSAARGRLRGPRRCRRRRPAGAPSALLRPARRSRVLTLRPRARERRAAPNNWAREAAVLSPPVLCPQARRSSLFMSAEMVVVAQATVLAAPPLPPQVEAWKASQVIKITPLVRLCERDKQIGTQLASGHTRPN